jgi:sRNA-binding protein
VDARARRLNPQPNRKKKAGHEDRLKSFFGTSNNPRRQARRKVQQVPLTNSTPAAKVKAARNPGIAAVIELLAETWPHCFSIYENRRRPLKIGIHLDILAALDGAVSAEELEQTLRCYVSNKVYRSRLVTGAIRVGLDGLPAGSVAEKDALVAKPKPATAVAASHSGDALHQTPLASNKNLRARSDRNVRSAGDLLLKSNDIFEAAPAHAVTAKRLSLADLRAAAQARKAAVS